MESWLHPGDQSRVVICTESPDLLDHLLAACAAADVEPDLMAGTAGLRNAWAEAAVVVIGADQAGRTQSLALPRRAHVYLAGVEPVDELAAHSARLGAALVVLPCGADWLATAVAERAVGSRGPARSLAVVGGSGGVGCSTLAAGLSFVAARQQLAVVLVEADPVGGGLDLLLGAERSPGWRWSRLARARGHLGDLSGQLPRADGVDVIAMARGSAEPAPGAEAVRAVLGSLARSHELVVIDAGRGVGPAARAAVEQAEAAILLTAGDVRGVAAARQVHAELAGVAARWGLLVRRPRSAGLAPEAAAEGFAMPLLGVVADEPGLAVAATRGEPPARSPRSPLGRTCRALLAGDAWWRSAA